MNKILVTQTSMPPYEEYINEIKDIWDSYWLTNMGPKHNLLELQLKKYLFRLELMTTITLLNCLRSLQMLLR